MPLEWREAVVPAVLDPRPAVRSVLADLDAGVDLPSFRPASTTLPPNAGGICFGQAAVAAARMI